MISLLNGVSVVNTVVYRQQVIIQPLDEDVATRGNLAQSSLEMLQLTQEVEVRGNGGSTILHKPYKETDRIWIRANSLSQLT